MKNYEVRPGVEVDFTAGMILVDMARLLAHLRHPDDISARYDLAFAVLTGLDGFAEDVQAHPSAIPTPSIN